MALISRTRKGISLIEVLIACTFLLIISGPVLNLFSQSVAGTIMNRDEMLANDYAADLMAVAKALPFDDLPVVERLHLNVMVADNYAEKPVEEGFDRYMTVIEFTDIMGSPYNYKVIVVEVEWESSGVIRSIKLPGKSMAVRSDDA